MSKPILIVRTPSAYRAEDAERVANILADKITDYHCFVIPGLTQDYDFKVFNGEYTEEEYKIIEDLIEDLKRESKSFKNKKPLE